MTATATDTRRKAHAEADMDRLTLALQKEMEAMGIQDATIKLTAVDGDLATGNTVAEKMVWVGTADPVVQGLDRIQQTIWEEIERLTGRALPPEARAALQQDPAIMRATQEMNERLKTFAAKAMPEPDTTLTKEEFNDPCACFGILRGMVETKQTFPRMLDYVTTKRAAGFPMDLLERFVWQWSNVAQLIETANEQCADPAGRLELALCCKSLHALTHELHRGPMARMRREGTQRSVLLLVPMTGGIIFMAGVHEGEFSTGSDAAMAAALLIWPALAPSHEKARMATGQQAIDESVAEVQAWAMTQPYVTFGVPGMLVNHPV